jgi:hypothetical protein
MADFPSRELPPPPVEQYELMKSQWIIFKHALLTIAECKVSVEDAQRIALSAVVMAKDHQDNPRDDLKGQRWAKA